MTQSNYSTDQLELVKRYRDAGLDLVLFVGDDVIYDSNNNKKDSKNPIYRWKNGATIIDYNKAVSGMQAGQWIGFVVPDNVLCVDIDNKNTLPEFEKDLPSLVDKGFIISKTTNGYHLYGRTPENSTKGSMSVTKNGLSVTARPGGQSCCIEAPSPGKIWLTDLNWQDLPVLPPKWTPVMSESKYASEQRKRQEEAKREAARQEKEAKREAARQEKEDRYISLKERIEDLVTQQIDIAANAQHGYQNQTYNRVAYTLGGLVAGTDMGGPVRLNEEDIKNRLLDICRNNCADGPEAAEKTIEAGWTSGREVPMVIAPGAIKKNMVESVFEEKKLQTLSDAIQNTDEVPIPNAIYTMEEALNRAKNIVLKKLNLFIYNNAFWLSPGNKERPYLLTTLDNPKKLACLFEGTFSYIDTDRNKPLAFYAGFLPLLALKVADHIKNDSRYHVNTITLPAVVNEKWVEKTSPGVYVLPLDTIQASCTAQESVQWILENIVDIYRYETPEDRGRVFGAIVGQRLRHNRLVPAMVYHAYQPGAGKTNISQFVALGSFEMPNDISLVTMDSNREEVRKLIAAFIKRGTCYLIVDNVKEKVDGSEYDSLITSKFFSGRLLGTNNTISCLHNMNIAFTLNNAELSKDMMRRVSTVRMLKMEEDEMKNIVPMEWVEKHLEEYRGHVENIIKEWVDSGSPQDTGQAETSFVTYTRDVAGLCQMFNVPVGQIVDEKLNKEEMSDDRDMQASMLLRYICLKYEQRDFSTKELAEDIFKDRTVLLEYERAYQLSASWIREAAKAVNPAAFIGNYTRRSHDEDLDGISKSFGMFLSKFCRGGVEVEGLGKVELKRKHTMTGTVWSASYQVQEPESDADEDMALLPF